MKTIKIGEATPIQLDWLVAKCEGHNFVHGAYEYSTIDERVWASGISPVERRYSTDLSQGGPIIEREKVDIHAPRPAWPYWKAYKPEWNGGSGKFEKDAQYGPSLLIAAMRCFVCSRLGETVEIPEELR